jgi:hypothetical protein
MNNRHELTGNPLLAQNVMDAVIKYGAQIGSDRLAPHDLRRTFAKLAIRPPNRSSSASDNVSIQTTERYLGVSQDLTDAPCDHLGIRLKV